MRIDGGSTGGLINPVQWRIPSALHATGSVCARDHSRQWGKVSGAPGLSEFTWPPWAGAELDRHLRGSGGQGGGALSLRDRQVTVWLPRARSLCLHV